MRILGITVPNEKRLEIGLTCLYGIGISKAQKILVFELDKLSESLAIFDELQIKKLDNLTIELPLWILVNIIPVRFETGLITLKLS